MSDVTRILSQIEQGDLQAAEQLLPLVYDELRRLAQAHLKNERPGHTLQSTALVHEAYLRLVDQKQVRWQNRAHFFAMASQMIRRILVDHARKRMASKRGGDQLHLSLSNAERFGHKPEVELIALDDALKLLAATNPQHSRVV